MLSASIQHSRVAVLKFEFTWIRCYTRKNSKTQDLFRSRGRISVDYLYFLLGISKCLLRRGTLMPDDIPQLVTPHCITNKVFNQSSAHVSRVDLSGR